MAWIYSVATRDFSKFSKNPFKDPSLFPPLSLKVAACGEAQSHLAIFDAIFNDSGKLCSTRDTFILQKCFFLPLELLKIPILPSIY